MKFLVLFLALLGAQPVAPGDAHEALTRALAADAEGDGTTANAALAALSDDPDTRLELGLDLVEAWWLVAHRERAINTLSKWHSEAPPSPDPIVRARTRALTGSPFDVDAALVTLTEADALCTLLPVALALDAVGQREGGQRLLNRALEAGGCDDASEQRAVWVRPRKHAVAASPTHAVSSPTPKQYVLGPGHEARFARVMPEQVGELTEGTELIYLGVPEDHVEAWYGGLGHPARTCADAPLCVTLRHPSVARAGDRIVGPFALRTAGVGEVEAEALLDGISARIRAEENFEPWVIRTVAPRPPAATYLPSRAAESRKGEANVTRVAGIVLGLLALLVVIRWLRRRARREA